MSEKGAISEGFIEKARRELVANRPLRENLPGGGLIHIDRQLPFICIYREPAAKEDAGTKRLVQSEASYIIAAAQEDITPLVEMVALTLKGVFGTFLVLEIWALDSSQVPQETLKRGAPFFRIFSMQPSELLSTVETLRNRLKQITVHRLHSEVELCKTGSIAPEGMAPLLGEDLCREEGIHLLGLGVSPLYRSESGKTLYPAELKSLRRGLGRALKQAFFRFTSDMTANCPTHFAMLGRRLVTRVVWECDRALAEVDDSFDFLLQVTPVNTEEAWREFEKSGFSGVPYFLYRPRPFDTADIKRKVYEIPIEKIEDPTLMELFDQKREELDRKLTMLADRDTEKFIYGSIPTYGRVERSLLETAEKMLDLLPGTEHENVEADAEKEAVDAESFAKYAEKEIEYYKRIYPEIDSRVEVRDDIVAGAMVSGGDFLISKSAHFPKNRVEALLNHEIGTHILTYINGTAQPLMQLHTGLSGYDEMQEGIAVLSEYLCGGISRARLRVLAARVIAVDMLCGGAGFPEVFSVLSRKYGFGEKSAFTITTRVFRGGGLTKDAVYLRGLVGIIDYLHGDGPLEPLFIGKIAAEHIPLVEELQWRGILKPPPLWPRWLERDDAKARLKEIRQKRLGLIDLIEKGYI